MDVFARYFIKDWSNSLGKAIANNYCKTATVSYLLIGFIDNSKVYLQIVLWESICVVFFQDSVCYYKMMSKIFENQYFQNVFELAKKTRKAKKHACKEVMNSL